MLSFVVSLLSRNGTVTIPKQKEFVKMIEISARTLECNGLKTP